MPTFASANEELFLRCVKLFYGVMVAQQILVLFVQVRILVEQHLHKRIFLCFVLWCNGSTTDSGPVCPGSNPGRTTEELSRREIALFC